MQPALLTVLLGGGIVWPFLLVAGGVTPDSCRSRGAICGERPACSWQARSSSSSSQPHSTAPGPWHAPARCALLFFLFLCVRNAMLPLARQLRALPVSASTLAGYVVVFSSFTWVPLLVMIAVLLTAGTGRLPAIDPSQLLLLGGMVALGHALSLLLDVPPARSRASRQ